MTASQTPSVFTSFADDLRRLADHTTRSADLAQSLADEAASEDGRCPLCARSHSGEVTPDYVRSVYRMRRLRDDYLPADLFADPAWDMLLDLTRAHLMDSNVSVSSLCIAAAVPTTTGLRWINGLNERGMIERYPDPADGRRIFVRIAERTLQAMLDYLSKVRQMGGHAL